jgi:multiple sugar transport system ATP-binding protein
MRTEINKLHTRLQTTMIYVTHDQVEAMTMGTKIAVMKDGVLNQVADPLTLYDKPVNKFVAGFIGSPPMNFMKGTIIKKDGRLYFNEGTFIVRILDDMKERLTSYCDKNVIFGIRPEDIHDKLFIQYAPQENTITATCEVIEPMGAEVYLYLNNGRHSFIARVGGHNRPAINQDMELVLDMSKVHFFNAETEETIL